jgi:hypothetical protein
MDTSTPTGGLAACVLRSVPVIPIVYVTHGGVLDEDPFWK